MNTVHIIAGVPGSGKTTVCRQLESHFLYIAHDDHEVSEYHKSLHQASKYGDGPVLAECPFRVSVLEKELHDMGVPYITYYLVEDLATTIKRYEARDGKQFPKMHLTNYAKYLQRSPRYTQEELLTELRALQHERS